MHIFPYFVELLNMHLIFNYQPCGKSFEFVFKF